GSGPVLPAWARARAGISWTGGKSGRARGKQQSWGNSSRLSGLYRTGYSRNVLIIRQGRPAYALFPAQGKGIRQGSAQVGMALGPLVDLHLGQAMQDAAIVGIGAGR